LGKKFQLQNDLAYWGYDRSYARSSVIVLATGYHKDILQNPFSLDTLSQPYRFLCSSEMKFE